MKLIRRKKEGIVRRANTEKKSFENGESLSDNFRRKFLIEGSVKSYDKKLVTVFVFRCDFHDHRKLSILSNSQSALGYSFDQYFQFYFSALVAYVALYPTMSYGFNPI